MNFFFRLALFFIFLLILAVVAVYVEIPYNINTRGVVVPVSEWRLDRLGDGTILNTKKDNLNNRISYYSVLEFQRGDHAEFVMNPGILDGYRVEKGDTVGRIRSFEEERRLLTLQSQLEEQRRLLGISLSGEKEQAINAAREKLLLAEKEYDTQQRLVARMKTLWEMNVIADEEWELALNEYLIKEQNVSIARSEMEIVSTGAKPEEQALIRSNINSFERQIEQTLERIDAFNILAPVSGTVIRQQTPEIDVESIIRVADLNRMIVTLPVELFQLVYIENGNHVNLRINSGRRNYSARIIGIDNTVQFINQKQNVFLTAVVEEEPQRFMPNMLVQAEIVCGEVSAWDYFKRMFKVVFEN